MIYKRVEDYIILFENKIKAKRLEKSKYYKEDCKILFGLIKTGTSMIIDLKRFYRGYHVEAD